LFGFILFEDVVSSSHFPGSATGFSPFNTTCAQSLGHHVPAKIVHIFIEWNGRASLFVY